MNFLKGIVPKTILFSFLIFTGVLILYFNKILDYAFVKAFYTAGLIALLNFLGGWIGIKYSSDKPYNLFLAILFGGMLARLFLMLILIIISLRFLDIKTDVFIFGIFIFYFFYLFIEILALFKEKRDVIR